MKKHGYIYIIKSGLTDFYKIGSTKDISQIMPTLQYGNPCQLTLVEYYKFENTVFIRNKLYEELREFWIRGEWHHCELEIIQKIVETCSHIVPPKNVFCWQLFC